jgi:hypothetical protein
VAAIAALVLAGFAAVEQAAEASSCGHYVKRMGPGFVPGQTAATQAAVDQVPANNTPCPCHGPECRRLPQLPTPYSPGAPVRLSAPQELIAIADRSLILSRPASWLAAELAARPSSGFPARLDRPPSL